MNREILKILTAIKDKTDICVAVLSEDGSIDISTFKEYFPLHKEDFKSTSEMFLKPMENRTVFKFTFSNKNFIGTIKGCDEVSLNYATFIKDYLENYQLQSSEQSYAKEYESIVKGESSKTKTTNFMNKYSISQGDCFCVIFKCETKRAKDIVEFVEDYSNDSSDNAFILDEYTVAYCKFTNKDVDGEYRSSKEYVNFIIQSMYEELGVSVSAFVGGKVSSFVNIALSYEQALITKQMKEALKSSQNVSSYKDFILVKMAEDIPKAKLEEYYSALLEPKLREILEDEEILLTGEEFLNNNLNVSETARLLHLHRNTLIYRLEKIEKISGLDLRRFNDALEFRILSILKRLLG